ncbi:hypothetical protein ACOSQ2_004225 [Xanthoceras sorbifolium]
MDVGRGVGTRRRGLLFPVDTEILSQLPPKKAKAAEPAAKEAPATDAGLSSSQKSPPSTIPHKAESSSIPQDHMQCQEFFNFVLNSANQFMTPEELASSADLSNEDRVRIGTGLLFQALGPLLEAEKKVSALEAENRALATEVATAKDAVASWEMEAINAKDRALSLLEQLADSQRELVLALKKVKSLEAEIPAKTAQAVEDFKASNKFDEHLLKDLDKEYDRGVSDCRNFICLTHPELDLKSLDNAIAKMTQKEDDSKSSDEAITKSNPTEEEDDQVEEEGNQVKEEENEDEDEDEDEDENEDEDEDEDEEEGIY